METEGLQEYKTGQQLNRDRYVKLFVRLRNLFETMWEVVLLISPDGQIIQSNKAASEIFGLSRNVLESMSFRSPILTFSDNRGELRSDDSAIGIVLETGRHVYKKEYTYRRPDSRIVHLECSASPIVNNGDFEGALALFRDITELKTLSRKLEDSHRNNIAELKMVDMLLEMLLSQDQSRDSLIEKVLQNANKHWLSSEKLSIEIQLDGLYYSTPSFTPTDNNESTPVVLENSVRGAVTVYFRSHPTPAEQEIPTILAKIIQRVLQWLDSGPTNENTIRALEQQVAQRTKSLEQANKMLQLEITRKRFQESELKRESAKLRAMLESSNLGFILLSPEYRVLEYSVAANSTVEFLYAHSLKSGVSILDILPLADRKRFTYYFSLAMTGEGTSHESCITDENGLSSWYSINLEPIRDEEGDISSVSLFVMDITPYMHDGVGE